MSMLFKVLELENSANVEKARNSSFKAATNSNISLLKSDVSTKASETIVNKINGDLSRAVQTQNNLVQETAKKADKADVTKVNSELSKAVQAQNSLMQETAKKVDKVEVCKLSTKLGDLEKSKDVLAKDIDEIKPKVNRNQINKVRDDVKYLQYQTKTNETKLQQFFRNVAKLSNEVFTLTRKYGLLGKVDESMGYALSGNMELVTLEMESMSKAELEAAAAGTYYKDFDVALQYNKGTATIPVYADHIWANMELPTLVPTEDVSDADVVAPTVVWRDSITDAPSFSKGICRLRMTMDTDAGVTKNFQSGTKSTGSITCVAKANLVDGETVTLIDALGTTVVFEFDVTGDGVTAGRTAVNVSGVTTDVEVAAVLANAITNSVLTIAAVAAGATINLTQNHALAAGDTVITETVANAGFTKVDFSGGVDRDYVTIPIPISGDNKWLGFTVSAINKIFYVVD